MSLIYSLETVEWFVEQNLVIFREEGASRRVHYFALAVVELLYDPDKDQHYIMCLDLTTGDDARMWPTADLLEWKCLKAAA